MHPNRCIPASPGQWHTLMTPSLTCARLLSAPQSGISPHRTPGKSTATCGWPSRFPDAPRPSAPGMPAARRTPPAPPPRISRAPPPALPRCGPPRRLRRPAPPPRPGTRHADPGRRKTMDITNNERMKLAATAYRAYIQHAAQMELPLAEDATEDDILADLVAGLHHYADSRGIGSDSAVASGQAAYERHRAGEDNPYRIGDEVRLRQRPGTGFPGRGVVVSIFPERDGEPAYHVRFPGQADTTPLRGGEIGPAASFPVVTTNQGMAASLAVAERLLVETTARIRACEQRQVPPHDHDLADKDSLLLAIGNACALAGSDVLRHLEPQVAAWTDVITQPWHPVHVTSATELAALDFPQPVQAGVLADAQSADAGARQDAPHRARS